MRAPQQGSPPSAESRVPDWAAFTPILANEIRRDPNGVLQRALTSFTTGATFSQTNWTPLADAPGAPAPPTAHKSSHATGGTDALAPADIGAATATDASNNAAAIAAETTRATAAEAALTNSFAAQPPGLVTALNPLTVTGVQAMSSANQMRGLRQIIPRNGHLRDLAIWIATQTSGNLELTIWDTSATTRNRLFTTGAVAASSLTANAWWIVDPNLAFNAADQVDFAISADSTVPTFARGTPGNWSVLPANFHPSPLGGAPKLAWVSGTAVVPGSMPTTYAESSMNAGSAAPLIIARMT